MTPSEFIQLAYTDVQALTDEGNQMHRRAVQGKRLVVHVHGWDRWAGNGRGGCAVTLRVEGQYVDRGERYRASSSIEAEAFAAEVEQLLVAMAPPV